MSQLLLICYISSYEEVDNIDIAVDGHRLQHTK